MKILCTIFLSIYSAFLFAQERSTVAVLEFQGNGISRAEAGTLTDEFRAKLVTDSIYIVLERDNMESILTEQGFQQTGCTTSDCAVEAGMLLGVKKMIAGSVGKLGSLFNVSIRMFDVGTGKIEKTVSKRYEGPIEGLLDIMEQLATEFGEDSMSLKKEEEKDYLKSKITIGQKKKNEFGLGAGMNISQSTANEPGARDQKFLFQLFFAHAISKNLFLRIPLGYTTWKHWHYQYEYLYEDAKRNDTYSGLFLTYGKLFKVTGGISMHYSILKVESAEWIDPVPLPVKTSRRESNFILGLTVGTILSLGKLEIQLQPTYLMVGGYRDMLQLHATLNYKIFSF